MGQAKFDIKEHVAEVIISQIKAGTPPWRCPWKGGASSLSFPLRFNGVPYRGINVLMLWCVAKERGYQSPYWMTFKQAKDLGVMVRKGERGTKTLFYGSLEIEQDQGVATVDQATPKRIHYAKANTVFNAEQIEGLPDTFLIAQDPPADISIDPDERVGQPDAELEAFFAATGAVINHSDDPRAYYDIKNDRIHMPRVELFDQAERYFGVLSHETIHWTGSARRLDRFKENARRTDDYAFEELVAEIGACFLCLHLGVRPTFDQSAAYVEGWLSEFENDTSMIFKAASQAQKAVDLIHDLVQRRAAA